MDISLFSPEAITPLPFEEYGSFVSLSLTLADDVREEEERGKDVLGERERERKEGGEEKKREEEIRGQGCEWRESNEASEEREKMKREKGGEEEGEEKGEEEGEEKGEEKGEEEREEKGEEEREREREGEKEKRSFVFLSIFKWEERKGWDILIKAFLSEFPSEKGVTLVILTNAFHTSADFENKIVEVKREEKSECLRERERLSETI